MTHQNTSTHPRVLTLLLVLGAITLGCNAMITFIAPQTWIWMTTLLSAIFFGSTLLSWITQKLKSNAEQEIDYEEKLHQSKSTQIFEAQNIVREQQLLWQRYSKIGIPSLYFIIFLLGSAALTYLIIFSQTTESSMIWHYAVLLAFAIWGIATWAVVKIMNHSSTQTTTLASGATKLQALILLVFVARETCRTYAHNAGFSDPLNNVTIQNILIAIFVLFLIDILISIFRYVYQPKNSLAHFKLCAPFLCALMGSKQTPISQLHDAILYQFGVQITFQSVIRFSLIALIPFILFQVIILGGLSCIIQVEPHQCAILPHGEILQPGLHFSWSRPEIIDSARCHTCMVGELDIHSPLLLKTSESKIDEQAQWVISATDESSNHHLFISQYALSLTFYTSEQGVSLENDAQILQAHARKYLTAFMLKNPKPLTEIDLLKKTLLSDFQQANLPVLAVHITQIAPPKESVKAYYANTLAYFEGKKRQFDAEKNAINTLSKASVDALKHESKATEESLEKITQSAIIAHDFAHKQQAYRQLGELYKTISALTVMKTYYPPLRKLFFALPQNENAVQRIMMELDLQEELAPSMLDPIL